MAEAYLEDIARLYKVTWRGVVEICLNPLLTPDQIEQAFQLIRNAPGDLATPIHDRFRGGVWKKIHVHFSSKGLEANEGGRAYMQLRYDPEGPATDAVCRRQIRQIFACCLLEATYYYRNVNAEQQRREARDLMVIVARDVLGEDNN